MFVMKWNDAYAAARCLCLFAILSPAVVNADLVIDIGDAVAAPGATNVMVPVSIQGGSQLTGATFAFQVGDGGPILGGTETIEISDIDYVTGTIWAPVIGDTSFVYSTQPDDLTPPIASATVTSTTITRAGVSTQGSGQLMTIKLDLSSVGNDRLGETIAITPIVDLGFGTISTVQNLGATVTTDFTAGTLSIQAVPEPSSFLLLGIATAFTLGIRGWRRHQLVVVRSRWSAKQTQIAGPRLLLNAVD